MTGPHLYDDGPEDLHTGTPRRSNRLLLGILGGTVLVGVGMVVALPLVTGTGEEQARQVVGVFTAALAADDLETAGDLLCQAERDRARAEGVEPGERAAGYAPSGTGEVVGVRPGELDGQDAQEVRVRWEDGGESTETTVVVVLEDGPRVCGSPAAG